MRPLEGVDAQQQLDVIDELLEAACRASRFLRPEDEAGARPYSGAVRAHAGRYLQLGSAGLGAACATSAWTISRADA